LPKFSELSTIKQIIGLAISLILLCGMIFSAAIWAIDETFSTDTELNINAEADEKLKVEVKGNGEAITKLIDVTGKIEGDLRQIVDTLSLSNDASNRLSSSVAGLSLTMTDIQISRNEELAESLRKKQSRSVYESKLFRSLKTQIEDLKVHRRLIIEELR